MRYSLVISTLTCGGAERVLSLLANEWVRRGNEVQLVTLDSEPPFFPLDPRVSLVQLDCERASSNPVQSLWNLYVSVRALRRALASFGTDRVLAFTTRVNVKALMAARPLGVPVVVSERTDPAAFVQPRFWQRLVDHWYPRAHRLVLQTPGVYEHFQNRGLTRLDTIPNPVEFVPVEPRVPSAPFLWLAVARLSHEKGIDLLLRAWSQSSQGRVNRLRILGDGVERKTLETLAHELGVAERVEFAGFVAEKAPHWRQAGAFVLSSRFEGFPNALCEALAAGLPCVSFDCPSGPASILRDGVNGLLVPAEDVSAMAAALDRMAADPSLRDRLATQAVHVVDSLGLSGITDRWERAFEP